MLSINMRQKAHWRKTKSDTSVGESMAFGVKNKPMSSSANIKKWSHDRELNPRPHPYHGCALPTELSRHTLAGTYKQKTPRKARGFLATFFQSTMEEYIRNHLKLRKFRVNEKDDFAVCPGVILLRDTQWVPCGTQVPPWWVLRTSSTLSTDILCLDTLKVKPTRSPKLLF